MMVNGQIDFTNLSTHFRILGVSPAWPAVQDAMRRLEDSKGKEEKYDKYQEDVLCVRLFAEMLRKNSQTIADALLCGAVIGKASAAEHRGERILLGLDAISRAHRFAEKPDQEVARILEDLRESIGSSRLELLKRTVIPEARDESSLESWEAAMKEALAGVDQENSLDRSALGEIRTRAWRAFSKRVEEFLAGRREPPPPGLNDLIALAAGTLPAALSKFDLREMTLADWSNALVTSLKNTPSMDPLYCPSWVGAAALLALGFSIPDPSQLLSWLVETKLLGAQGLSDVESWLIPMPKRLRMKAPERAALIVKAPADSLVESWRPSSSSAALAVTPEQAKELLKGLRRVSPPPLTPALQVIAFEVSGLEPGLDADILGRIGADASLKPRPLYLYPRSPSEAPRGRFLVAPKSVDEFFGLREDPTGR
jgi:hypothetical protein